MKNIDGIQIKCEAILKKPLITPKFTQLIHISEFYLFPLIEYNIVTVPLCTDKFEGTSEHIFDAGAGGQVDAQPRGGISSRLSKMGSLSSFKCFGFRF